MENEKDLKKPATNKTAQKEDPAANIETVVPTTEELIPETPVNEKEDKEDKKLPNVPIEEHTKENDSNDDANDIETVAP